MKKEQEKTLLTQLIDHSAIHEVLQKLTHKLGEYKKGSKLESNRYIAALRIDELTSELTALENHLYELKKQSQKWEDIE